MEEEEDDVEAGGELGGSGAARVPTLPGRSSELARSTSPRRLPTVNTRTALRQQQSAGRFLAASLRGGDGSGTSARLLSRLVEREQMAPHAPGIRQAGCPCCDPDNPSNVVDQLMLL
jgi:hypothetical protein